MKFNRKYFDDQFSNYEKTQANGWGMSFRISMIYRMQVALDMLLEEAEKRKGPLKILEIGCASGDFTRMMKDNIKEACEILGSDVSEKAVAICRERFSGTEGVKFAGGGLPGLSRLLQEKFDLIVCMDVLCYFDRKYEKEKAVEDLEAMMSDGAACLIMVPYEKKDVERMMEVLRTKFKICGIRYNTNYTFGQLIEPRLYRLYGSSGIKAFRALMYRLLTSEKLMNFFRGIDRLFPPKATHILVLVRKKR